MEMNCDYVVSRYTHVRYLLRHTHASLMKNQYKNSPAAILRLTISQGRVMLYRVILQTIFHLTVSLILPQVNKDKGDWTIIFTSHWNYANLRVFALSGNERIH